MCQKVYIIILNWNGLKDTLECLESVYKLDYPNFEVIVVDNGSSDGSISKILQQVPQINLIRNSKNLGYTGGNNVGMRRALELGADYVWLLNNDTVVESDTLSKLVDEAENFLGTGLVSPALYFYDRPEKTQFIGTYADFKNHELIHILDPKELDCEWVKNNLILWGTALLIKKCVIEAVGYLSEEYFAYHEDCDYSLRVHRARFRVVVRLDARVFHKDSQTTGKWSPIQVYLRTRNQYFLWMDNEKGFRRIYVLSHYISNIILCAKYLLDEGNKCGLDACLNGFWAAIRGKGGAYDSQIVMPFRMKYIFNLILSWHPYFWANLFKGNAKIILHDTITRLQAAYKQ